MTTESTPAPALRRNGFTFKQFFVAHDRCAMKVGTDGVLLGAWAPVDNAGRILDIGTGSGLIALMLAQRTSPGCEIDAVELDADAAEQARENAGASPWADRIKVLANDIHQVARENVARYALIVSNPPYFEPAVACRDAARTQARYTETLSHDALLACAAALLEEGGQFCVVLPYEIGERFIATAQADGWYPARRTVIRDRPGKPLHRMLLALARSPVTLHQDELALRDEDGSYSAAFRQMITDFYLFY
ncbi:tRNA(1)(Val) (adenine(37)-N(6))-methyltransferase TrmN [Chimaeribacter californicus]|uniref:tRNA(1)(Val) (adenine(37)-N(6))-methyltransferase TrmN n=1 Tax=Chimaeribacter californicus TaxID=2060067 RepID=UPI001F4DEA6F|nr:tRNA1(Val) (adenine(37)-N6)-methyltransferase [Chimaeribacter californicus]